MVSGAHRLFARVGLALALAVSLVAASAVSPAAAQDKPKIKVGSLTLPVFAPIALNIIAPSTSALTREFATDYATVQLTLTAFLVQHGNIPALGYRIGDAAYTPDLHDIPEESWSALEGLDLWIVDGLRYAQHPSHFSVRDALKWIDRFKPKRAVITNMHADLDYAVMRKELPPGVIPAYDGMRLTLSSE